MSSINEMIKRPSSKVFRRFLVKRRQLSDGQFESDWQDLTKFVKKWGKFHISIDTPRYGDIKFNNAALGVANVDGTFNPSDNESSFWYGYGDLQRSLVKIEAGYIDQQYTTAGYWVNTEYPSNTSLWVGIISGDIFPSEEGHLSLPLRPVQQVFRDYPAHLITGLTSTGIISVNWFEFLRNQQDGSGNYLFKPFIGDAQSNDDWLLETITTSYNLTSTAAEIYNMDCWAVATKICQADNAMAYINRLGQFVFQSKTTTASVQYEFHGLNSHDRTYGQTVKKINYYGKRLTSFYSRVSVKFDETDTTTSFADTALSFSVSGTNTAWNLGSRTYRIENLWLEATQAAAVASNVFEEVSTQKNEISFVTTFIPHLNLMDRISVTYDNSTQLTDSKYLWDYNNWGDDASEGDNDLYWADDQAGSVVLEAAEFKLLSIEIDLDNLETNFVAKEI